jgi:hypothetical protein
MDRNEKLNNEDAKTQGLCHELPEFSRIFNDRWELISLRLPFSASVLPDAPKGQRI